jgi:hypothetical protein
VPTAHIVCFAEKLLKFNLLLVVMAQKLWAGALGETGIVAVLFIIGIFL